MRKAYRFELKIKRSMNWYGAKNPKVFLQSQNAACTLKPEREYGLIDKKERDAQNAC